MKHLTLAVQGLTNGTWVATLMTTAGAAVTVCGPSPSDAAINCFEALGVDHLASFVKDAKQRLEDQEAELETLKLQYHEMLKVNDALVKAVRTKTLELKADWTGQNHKQLIGSLEQLTAPWPPN